MKPLGIEFKCEHCNKLFNNGQEVFESTETDVVYCDVCAADKLTRNDVGMYVHEECATEIYEPKYLFIDYMDEVDKIINGGTMCFNAVFIAQEEYAKELLKVVSKEISESVAETLYACDLLNLEILEKYRKYINHDQAKDLYERVITRTNKLGSDVE
jgi:hypothetical protein